MNKPIESPGRTSLDDLRKSCTEIQRRILDGAWDYLVKNDRPIPARVFYARFDRDEADAAMRGLGGHVIIQGYWEGIAGFQPTLLGALLSSGGAELERILEKCFRFVRRKYEEMPDVQSIPNQELKQDGGFSDAELEHLRILLSQLSHSLVVRSAGHKGSPWTLLVYDEVDKLRKVSDWAAYIHSEVTKNFDSSFPVGEAERVALMAPSGNVLNLDYASTTSGPSLIPGSDPLSFAFVSDDALRVVLESDWLEANRALSVEAWKSCIILCGGMVEGMLLSLTRSVPEQELGKRCGS